MLREKYTYIYRSLKIIWRSSRFYTLLNAFVVVLSGVLPILLIFIIKLLVDEISKMIANQGNHLDFNALYLSVGIAATLFLVNAIVGSVSGLVKEKHSYFISDYIQNLIHQRTTTFDFSNFEDVKFQNVFYRAINEASFRPTRIYYGFVKIIQNLITLLFISGILAVLHWGVLVGLLVASVPVIYIRLRYSGKMYDLKKKYTEEERLVNYHNRLLTGKEFAKELRMFNLASLFKKRYEDKKNRLRNKHFKILKVKAFREVIFQIIAAVVLLLVFVYVAYQAINGVVTQGEMVMYLLALYRGHGFLQELLSNMAVLYEDGLFLRNFFEFLDYKSINKKPDQSQLLKFPDHLSKGIEIRNLDFKYPNSKRFVFENLNVSIKEGETVALVGANGAGKTTLVKLLCGLYKPTKGSVFYGGVDTNDLNRSSLAKNVSVIFQDFMLYNTTAKENIWFGDISKDINDADLYESSKKSGIHSTLTNLPKGYDTTLGTLFKNSEMLSLGEWQRMALARSFFSDAQVVILDEPTSSMDAYTEGLLIKNFKEIIKGRTAIIVSHRLSSIRLADRILVLQNHQLVEDGTHEELIEKQGVYYDMINMIRY